MEQSTTILGIIHLIILSLWGGVVATEAVIEIMPFRQMELHTASIRFHYWIDLLVELPLIIAVAVTGTCLLYVSPTITPLHWVKISFALAAIAINIYCIVIVLRRARDLGENQPDQCLWNSSRKVLACFGLGLCFAAVAATLGFRLAMMRLAG